MKKFVKEYKTTKDKIILYTLILGKYEE